MHRWMRSGSNGSAAGDIVCYGSHVGIYIGGGKMIHAPKPGDVVKIASVTDLRGTGDAGNPVNIKLKAGRQ